jgi:hypothetical protein
VNPLTFLSGLVQRVLTPGPKPNITASGYTATVLGIVGLAIWLLQTYVYHHAVPAPIQAAIFAVAPGIVAYFATRITRSTTVVTVVSAMKNKASVPPGPGASK